MTRTEKSLLLLTVLGVLVRVAFHFVPTEQHELGAVANVRNSITDERCDLILRGRGRLETLDCTGSSNGLPVDEFCGEGDCKVTTLYDQVGDQNIIQNEKDFQPVLARDGADTRFTSTTTMVLDPCLDRH